MRKGLAGAIIRGFGMSAPTASFVQNASATAFLVLWVFLCANLPCFYAVNHRNQSSIGNIVLFLPERRAALVVIGQLPVYIAFLALPFDTKQDSPRTVTSGFSLGRPYHLLAVVASRHGQILFLRH